MVSSNASFSFAEIAAARATPDQPLFFQLYKPTNMADAEARVSEAIQLGYNAIFLTVDAIVAGWRERDVRAPWVAEEMERAGNPETLSTEGDEGNPDRPFRREDMEKVEEETGGTAELLLSTADRDMTWETTIPWLRSITKLPIVLKGIQCVADAVLACEAGVDGILLSNHGGMVHADKFRKRHLR